MADGLAFTTRVVLNNWPAIKAHMVLNADNATAKAAHDMEAGMKGRVAVDTGFLKNSIQARKVGTAHWRVTVTAEYGIYLEYGTRHMRAQPFFFPTVAEVTPAFMAAMRRITT